MNILKQKKFMILLVISLLITSVYSFGEFTKSTGIEKFKQQANVSQNHVLDKVQLRIEKAWQDIEDTLEIDTEGYIQISPVALSDLDNYFSSNQAQDIRQNGIRPFMRELPTGAVMPLIYVKEDGQEVVFGYKEADGTNVLKRSVIATTIERDSEEIILNSEISYTGNWVKKDKEKRIKGADIIDID